MHPAAKPFAPDRLLVAIQSLPAATRWWIAYSGGADSSALLHAMARLRERIAGDLQALHVDHGLHEGAANWAQHCREVCRWLDIPLRCERIQVRHDSGVGIEAEARRRRYELAASLLGPGDILLTAHQADDQAETVLLNLMRGSGVDGLAGMPPVRPLGRGLLARPLLAFSGASLRSYLNRQGHVWVEDSSNMELAYDRNFVRHQLLPLLENRWPGARDNLALSARHCREASQFLADTIRSLLHRCTPIPAVLELHALHASLDGTHRKSALKLVLREWLRVNDAPPMPRQRLQECLRQLESTEPDGRLEIRWEAWVLRWFRDRLWLQREDDIQPCPECDARTGSVLDLGPVLGEWSLLGAGPYPDWPLRIQARRGGERLRCLAGGKHRSVKHLLQEARVPPWLRESIPLLWLNDEVVAVADWVLDLDFKRRLDRRGLRLHWRPSDPVLRLVAGMRKTHEVDRDQALG